MILEIATGKPYTVPAEFVLERLQNLESRVMNEDEFHEYCSLVAKMIDPETGEYVER
jgi:hypothetical protein